MTGARDSRQQRVTATNATTGQRYCCGGGQCRISVPQPPNSLPHGVGLASQALASNTIKQYANATHTFQDPQNILPQQADTRGGLSLCAANPKTQVSNFTGIFSNIPWIVTYWADLSPNSSCKWTPRNLLLSGCTGNQLAPHLVLTAAHCVDLNLKQDDTGCGQLSLVRMVLCYGFTRQPGGSRECSNGVEAVGVNWHSYPETAGQHDQAIVFTAVASPTSNTSTLRTWLASPTAPTAPFKPRATAVMARQLGRSTPDVAARCALLCHVAWRKQGLQQGHSSMTHGTLTMGQSVHSWRDVGAPVAAA